MYDKIRLIYTFWAKQHINLGKYYENQVYIPNLETFWSKTSHGVVLEKENGPPPPHPPSKFNKTQYLLTEAKFEFAVKAKKFLISV